MPITPSDPLASTQAALPVSLIATPRAALFTCDVREKVSDVLTRYPDFDHIPVTENGKPDGRMLGLLDAHRFQPGEDVVAVSDVYCHLGEEHLIGADAPIIDFVLGATEGDCKLLVSGKSIAGLVTVSDLQALPVRAALFTLVTRLELLMAERIKATHPDPQAWLARLSKGRQEKLHSEMKEAKEGEAFVDALLFTQFADKKDILAKAGNLPTSRRQFEKDLDAAQELRDELAHANEYASSRTKALEVCHTVKAISIWISRLSS